MNCSYTSSWESTQQKQTVSCSWLKMSAHSSAVTMKIQLSGHVQQYPSGHSVTWPSGSHFVSLGSNTYLSPFLSNHFAWAGSQHFCTSRSWQKLLLVSSWLHRRNPWRPKYYTLSRILSSTCRLVAFSCAWIVDNTSPTSRVDFGNTTVTCTASTQHFDCSWRLNPSVASFQLQ